MPEGIIIDPRSGDKHRAADVLGEIQELLRKYGYALVFDKANGVMVLGQVGQVIGSAMTGRQMQVRAVAVVSAITPTEMLFCEVDWTPKLKGSPN